MHSETNCKKILLLSDHESVAKIIEQIRSNDLAITRFLLPVPGEVERKVNANDFDLLILALSSYANEPLVALARTSLAGLIGRMPILVISDKPFQSDPATQISHLDFPFSIEQLIIRIDELLHMGSGLPRPPATEEVK